ncbi:unnamed protein product [Calypogeia fissa]
MPFRKLYAARDIELASNKMHVGPSHQRSPPPPKSEDGVCQVPQGIIYGQRSTPTNKLGMSVTSKPLGPNKLQRLPSRGASRGARNGEVKSSPLYFGSSCMAVESGQSGLKYWKRPEGASTDAERWFRCSKRRFFASS